MESPSDNMACFAYKTSTRAAAQAVAGEAALDVVAFETVPCLKELRAISRLMRTEFPGTPAWVSCSCKDAEHIAHGESLAGDIPLYPNASSSVPSG